MLRTWHRTSQSPLWAGRAVSGTTFHAKKLRTTHRAENLPVKSFLGLPLLKRQSPNSLIWQLRPCTICPHAFICLLLWAVGFQSSLYPASLSPPLIDRLYCSLQRPARFITSSCRLDFPSNLYPHTNPPWPLYHSTHWFTCLSLLRGYKIFNGKAMTYSIYLWNSQS